MKQMNQSSTGFERQTKTTRKREFLDKMNLLMSWAAPSSFRLESNGDYRWRS